MVSGYHSGRGGRSYSVYMSVCVLHVKPIGHGPSPNSSSRESREKYRTKIVDPKGSGRHWQTIYSDQLVRASYPDRGWPGIYGFCPFQIVFYQQLKRFLILMILFFYYVKGWNIHFTVFLNSSHRSGT